MYDFNVLTIPDFPLINNFLTKTLVARHNFRTIRCTKIKPIVALECHTANFELFIYFRILTIFLCDKRLSFKRKEYFHKYFKINAPMIIAPIFKAVETFIL